MTSSRGALLAVTSVAALLLFAVGCNFAERGGTGRETGAPRFDVVEATIADLQSAIRSGQATCRQIVQTYLDRIAAYDQSTDLNAITVVNLGALGRATQIDDALAAGREVGPLFCAPVLVKDNFDTRDLPTTGGSVVLENSVPPTDAFMVQRLREAGAIVLAKTNMAEWAFSPRRTESSTHGTTANAYALDRVPAGSSGGTASGVAASFGVAGLGSDTGNSIRGPSSHLALFGIRSTIGLTSRSGIIPLIFDRDVGGPMTRTVEDGARLFDALAGHDPSDALSEEGRREADYTERLRADGLQGVRLGVLRALSKPEETDPEILERFETALDDLREAGAEIVDPFEVADFEAHVAAESFCASFRYDMAEYLKTLGSDAPIQDVQEAYDRGAYSPYVKEDLEFFLRYPADTAPADWAEPCPLFLDHPKRRDFLAAMTEAMDQAEVDAVLYPTWTAPPAPLDRPREEYRGDNSQTVAPDTGMPAVSVPMGYLSDGLPVGLQILGRRFEDGKLIQYAYAYEQATHHRKAPEDFPAIP